MPNFSSSLFSSLLLTFCSYPELLLRPVHLEPLHFIPMSAPLAGGHGTPTLQIWVTETVSETISIAPVAAQDVFQQPRSGKSRIWARYINSTILRTQSAWTDIWIPDYCFCWERSLSVAPPRSQNAVRTAQNVALSRLHLSALLSLLHGTH